MNILAAYADGRLASQFGELTLGRGREYAALGRVSQVTSTESGELLVVEAKVRGGGGRDPTPHPTPPDHTPGEYLDTRCTCPVMRMCKHGAAVVLTVRDATSDGSPA